MRVWGMSMEDAAPRPRKPTGSRVTRERDADAAPGEGQGAMTRPPEGQPTQSRGLYVEVEGAGRGTQRGQGGG